jgi:hypothetical protein
MFKIHDTHLSNAYICHVQFTDNSFISAHYTIILIHVTFLLKKINYKIVIQQAGQGMINIFIINPVKIYFHFCLTCAAP